MNTLAFLALSILAAYKIHADLLPYYPRWKPYEWVLELWTAFVAMLVAAVALLPIWTGVI